MTQRFQSLVLAMALVAPRVSAAHTFLSIGDWGGASIGGQIKQNVDDVAAQLATTAKASDSQFIVGTGDNIYWCGVTSLEDPQFVTDYEEPYADRALQVPWYHVLGNHEYGYNVSAQILYSNVSDTWILDDRYYTRRVEIGSTGTYISFIMIDTSPCVADYRSDSNEGWDPCGDEYPTCSLQSTDDDFQGPCQFHDNILTQDCGTQLEWFKSALATVPEEDWLIVVGHHPIDECDVEDLTSVLQSHGFDLYLNGHHHMLIHYTVDNAGAYITTGAGSMVDTPDQHHGKATLKREGKDIPARNGAQGGTSHSYETVWKEVVAGFTRHTFNDDLTELTNDFLSYSGEVLHSFTVTKRNV